MTIEKGVGWGTGKMTSSRFKACLLGGAIGDALGYPVEFMTRDAILGLFGNEGFADLVWQVRRRGLQLAES